MEVLSGLRVVDLSNTMTGAQLTQILSDFGAEVLHVEPPGGSPLRECAGYAFWARGKKSAELNLELEADREAVRGLAARSDVLVETFRPGVAEQMGLGFDELAQLNPRLVYASITGFGRRGPYSRVKGYEGVVMAKIGGFQVFQQISTPPRASFSAVPWCSFAASQAGLHGVLGALYERERSGLGQWVEANLAQSFVALDLGSWFLQLVGQRYPDAYRPVLPFADDGTPNSAFAYTVLPGLTADGHWLQFSQARPHLLRAFLKALDLGHLFDDPYWKGLPQFDDAKRRDELLQLMLEGVHKKTLQEWQLIFAADPNVWAEPFRLGPDVLAHPQFAFEEFPVEIEDAEQGRVLQPGPLVRFEKTPAQLGRRAPRRNEHGGEVGSIIAESPAPVPPAASIGRLPLDGVTILEFAYLMAAPYGTAVLSDLGARVIKVEPFEGDPIRQLLPFPEAGGVKVMQGKESICIDLATHEGQQVVRRLAASADVVVQSFRPRVAERLGVDAKSLAEVNPGLVYLNAAGYGTAGPCAEKPAFAPCIAAAGGISTLLVGDALPAGSTVGISEIRRGSKTVAGAAATMNAQADGIASLVVGTALLLGVLARTRGLPAQSLFTTMLGSVAHAVSYGVVRSESGPPAPSVDETLCGFNAQYRMYESSDGWVFLAVPTDDEWTKFVTPMRRYVDLVADPRFTTPEDRSRNDQALVEVLAGVFRTRPSLDWERDLLDLDVACVAVTTSSVESVMWHEEFGRAAGYVVDVVHPTFDEHPRLAPLVRFSRSSTQALPGCLAGQHTNALLQELGYDDAAIGELRDRGIVGP